jgi:hypothetical protein
LRVKDLRQFHVARISERGEAKSSGKPGTGRAGQSNQIGWSIESAEKSIGTGVRPVFCCRKIVSGWRFETQNGGA